MKLKQYQVDAFANNVFEGNPAAVCQLEQWLSDDLMQAIAFENNLAETAFIVKEGSDYRIRWFTPTVEVDLCGHATLASAFVLFNELGFSRDSITFNSNSGPLIVSKKAGLLEMDFPNEAPILVNLPSNIADCLGLSDSDLTGKCYLGGDLIVELVSEQAVLSAKPDLTLIQNIDVRGLIITAKSERYDFVNRCFFPRLGIPEDPVTGSAFTQLVPMWAERLSKQTLKAKQVSSRGGEVYCQLNGDRVALKGKAILFMRAEIEV